MSLFELDRETMLLTDWSKTGVGYLLQQKHCQCPMDNAPHCGEGHWKTILVGSRFLKDAETRYAPVEGEALRLVYGLESTRDYCMGNPKLTVGVDHKLLVAIMGDKELDQIKNPRLRNLKDKTIMYKFAIKHIPGTLHTGPDAASRYPGSSATHLSSVIRVARDIRPAEPDTKDTWSAGMASALEDFQAVTWNRLVESSVCDETCAVAIKYLELGFPEEKSELPEHLRPLWHWREELYTVDNVLCYANRMFIPQALRREVLETLHTAHQGVANMKASARERFFWPGMDADIKEKRNKCAICNQMSPSQPREELLADEAPTFLFEQTCMDYFSLKGHTYCVEADKYSGWLYIRKMVSTDMEEMTSFLRSCMDFHGVPKVIESDGGPPFNSGGLTRYLQKWGIRHRLSSASYAQSNGRAELAVKSAKRILADCTLPSGSLDSDAVTRALMTYRITPLRGIGESPAEIIFGRRVSDTLPECPQQKWRDINDGREIGMARLKKNKAEDYNLHTWNLQPLVEGDNVTVQNMTGTKPLRWDKTGKVVEVLNNRQYSVKMDGSRRIRLKNRRYLKLYNPFIVDGPIHKSRLDSVEDTTQRLVSSTPQGPATSITPRLGSSTSQGPVTSTPTRRPGRLQPHRDWQQQQQELAGRQTPDRVFEELNAIFESPLRQSTPRQQQDTPRVSFREENSATPARPSPIQRTRLELLEDKPATPIQHTRTELFEVTPATTTPRTRSVPSPAPAPPTGQPRRTTRNKIPDRFRDFDMG